MQPGKSSRRRAAWARSLAALALACALAPAAVSAAASRPSDGDLSPRLAELAKPSVRSAPPAEQAEELGLAAEGPGSLLRDGNRVLVEVRFDHGAPSGADDLRATGAMIVNISPRYQIVTIAAKPAELRRLSRVPRVTAATEVLAPITYGSGDPGPVASATTPCFGSATSEGDEQLGAAQAREEFEVDGSGVKVGILSDSFDQDEFAPTHEAEDIESGDLPGAGNRCGWPTPTQIVEPFEPEPEDPEPADEGRAMAQIVHDLAPGASLAFASAFNGLTTFAENVGKLRDVGADVIVDDVFYFVEPFFQEGPVDVAVSDVTASGVSYFTAAGNNNLIHDGKDIASWEAPQFRDSEGCPGAVVALSEALEEFGEPGLNPTHCMDFNPGPEIDRNFRVTVSPGATLIVDLQWAEPWEGVDTDIDAFLVDPSGTVATGSIDDNVFTTERPFEFLAWENETEAPANVQLAVNRYSGVNPRLKFALVQNGGGVSSTEYESSLGEDVIGPTVFGHAGAKDAMSIGAIRFNTNEEPEYFSSRGPTTHHFGPVNGTTPAAELPSPEMLVKPDVVATDGGVNTFFGSCQSDVWRFFGTSAAAPHAAAIAALQRQAKPTASPSEVGQAQRDGATAVGAFPPEAVGAGMVDAPSSIEQLGVAPSSPGALPEPSPVSGPCFTEPEPEPPPAIPVVPATETTTSFSPAGTTPRSSKRTAPHTFLRRRPPKVLRTDDPVAKAVFSFGSNEAGVTFLCKFDRATFRLCRRRTVWHPELGWHVLRVKARDADGDTDPTPAVFRFRVLPAG